MAQGNSGTMGRIFPNLRPSNPGMKSGNGVNLNDPLFSHLGRAGIGAMELGRGHNTTTRNNPMTDRSKAGGKKPKHWEQGAVKHPGVEKAKAKRNGVSTHEQLERDSHSSDPTTRRRGVLGLTFERQAAKRKGK